MRQLGTAVLTLALTLLLPGPLPASHANVAPQDDTASRAAAASPIPGAVGVVAVGDIVCAPGQRVTATTCRHRATARLTASLRPSYVIGLGDLQYEDGRLADFRSEYDPSWGRFNPIMQPVPGNHEYRTPGARGYFTYFGQQAPGYRAVDIGRWRVYLLNSNCGRVDCAREQRWLARDLEAHPHRCTAIATHHPRYSSGEHGSDPAMTGFWRVAHRHRVDVALSGHDHDYERFTRMDADGRAVPRGVLSFVSGAGGKSLYAKEHVVPGSRYFQSARPGVLQLWLGRGELAWRFRTIDGEVRDSGRRSCI